MGENGCQPLHRRDWLFIMVCVAVGAISIAVIAHWFSSAFPEASIDFRYDGRSSQHIAGTLAAAQGFPTGGMMHTVTFESDEAARIFLERSLGLKRANQVMQHEVRLWYWRHRWFRPLQEDELTVEIAPTGELVSMTRTIPESRAMPSADASSARSLAQSFLVRAGTSSLELISQSERQLPARLQRIYTFRSRSVNPAGAEYRHTVTVDGSAVSSYSQRLKVPDQWLRGYRELRSKNGAAGNIDLIFLIGTMVAALVVFVMRLRRGDLALRFLLGVGVVAFILSAGSNLNSYPTALADYDTTTSFPAFLIRFAFLGVVIPSIGAAMLLIVICGAGEVLYRQRYGNRLALPRLWTAGALGSKRIFLSIVLGYTMVAFFIAYQTLFYVVAEKFGAWAPAEIPYDNTLLGTPMPWLAVLFAGFFPALSEEFLSRAFSIPLFERMLRFRSPLLAIVLSAYIWGFGHATYPNQPFYIRGLEVGTAGVLIGFLLPVFGLLPLLIWHFTVDALYTALMLLRSGNLYYVISGALASMVFTIPLVASIVLYVRRGGFVPDGHLDNATLPVSETPLRDRGEEEIPPLPAPVRPSGRLLAAGVLAVGLAIFLTVQKPVSPEDAVDYRISEQTAKARAVQHLRALRQPLPSRVAAAPVSAFRSWEADSPREEGGAPGGFDEVAATYMIRRGMPMERLVTIMRTTIPTATWTVRFFTPLKKSESFVEVDARTGRVVGYHRYADEQAPGQRLDRSTALAIAQNALSSYGVWRGRLLLRDALTFEQPNRRDWLFHFEEPLFAEARRRVSIRVLGSEVTQVATTVRVPDSVYRQAREQKFINVVLLIIRLAGAVAALALVVSGFIMATRHGIPHWRRAAGVVLLLSMVTIVRIPVMWETRLFTYSTSISWDTFLVNAATNAVRDTGLQILLIAVAVAAIFAAHPSPLRLFSREGRSRFGAHAALAAVTSIGLLVSGKDLLRLASNHFPTLARVSTVSVPDEASIAFPLLLDLSTSIVGAVVFAGAAAAYAVACASWKHRWSAPLVTMLTLFCLTLDSSASAAELPMALLTSAAVAALVWIISRWVLDGNPLAWFLAALSTSLLESGAAMMQNHRADLQVQGAIALSIVIVTWIWAAWEYRRVREGFTTAHAPGD